MNARRVADIGGDGTDAVRHRRPLPARLPQQTFAEAKAVGIAIGAGHHLTGWGAVEGEVALRHGIEGAALEVKLTGGPLLDTLGLPKTIESLRAELKDLRLPAVLLLHVLLGAALRQAECGRLYAAATLDELIAAIGWVPHSTADRKAMRRRVWRWLLLTESLVVIGERRGMYRDPETRKVLDLTSRDALIRVMGQRREAGLVSDSSEPPLEVTFAPGPWVEQWLGRRDILAYFGDVRRLAEIPAGKPAGAWAQAIGLALQQIWRERASRTVVAHAGEDRHLTVRPDTVTRRQLLDMFPPTPTVHEVLGGPNPRRAKDYWKDAIQLLREQGLVGRCAEVRALAPKRQGWADDWLDQPLEIRPKDRDVDAVAEIARRASAASRARRRRMRGRAADRAGTHGVA
jgi:hypothetical protein